MARAAIIGATGYGGVELVRLLSKHPDVELAHVTSESYAGRFIDDVYPHLAGLHLPLEKLDPEAVPACDYAFLATPAGLALSLAPRLIEKGARVIDVSPDFRLRDPAVYEKWYKQVHTCPELLREAAFGLPEWNREAISQARLVAVPGCYTTAALLALGPLVNDGLIEPRDIVIDGKTGVSGAGRTSLKLQFHFPEADEDVAAYSVGGHRHMPEMVQELGRLTGSSIGLCFTPHLAPLSRGMLVTAYARPTAGCVVGDLCGSLQSRYRDEPFVHVLPEGTWPHTKWTTGTNHCFLSIAVDEASGRAVILSAIDNVGKGQAGQMVQCLNIMMDVGETLGLELPAAYP